MKEGRPVKITDKIVSIPPYISTTWDKVSTLHKKHDSLVFTLLNGTNIEIDSLSDDAVNQIFAAHAAFLEHAPTVTSQAKPLAHTPTMALSQFDQIFAAPLKIVFGTLESVAQALQHNPAYSDLPPIPEEIAAKLASLAKILNPDDVRAMPEPVADCNCMHCQMMRLIKGSTPQAHPDHPHFEKSEDEISDEELQFEEWQVHSIGEKMYLVTNKLDPNEQYTVFLGEPIGCTCGKANCEHIVAVLRH